MARKQFNYVVDGNSVTVQRLTYADLDAPAEIAEEVTFQVADVPAELTSGEAVVSLASYGLSQLLQDRVSSVAAEGKMEAMQAVYEMLKEGQWKAQRESTGGERKATIDSFFATGFALFLQSKGKDVDATVATAMLQGMSADERKAVRAADQVKPFIQKAKDQAAAQAADIDLESLLG